MITERDAPKPDWKETHTFAVEPVTVFRVTKTSRYESEMACGGNHVTICECENEHQATRIAVMLSGRDAQGSPDKDAPAQQSDWHNTKMAAAAEWKPPTVSDKLDTIIRLLERIAADRDLPISVSVVPSASRVENFR